MSELGLSDDWVTVKKTAKKTISRRTSIGSVSSDNSQQHLKISHELMKITTDESDLTLTKSSTTDISSSATPAFPQLSKKYESQKIITQNNTITSQSPKLYKTILLSSPIGSHNTISNHKNQQNYKINEFGLIIFTRNNNNIPEFLIGNYKYDLKIQQHQDYNTSHQIFTRQKYNSYHKVSAHKYYSSGLLTFIHILYTTFSINSVRNIYVSNKLSQTISLRTKIIKCFENMTHDEIDGLIYNNKLIDINDVWRAYRSIIIKSIFSHRVHFAKSVSGISHESDVRLQLYSGVMIQNLINRLCDGVFIDGEHICLYDYVGLSMIDYPEWIIPSGRIRYRETEITCAIRVATEFGGLRFSSDDLRHDNFANIEKRINIENVIIDNLSIFDHVEFNDILSSSSSTTITTTENNIIKKYYVLEVKKDEIEIQNNMSGIKMSWVTLSDLMTFSGNGQFHLSIFEKLGLHAFDATTPQSSPPADIGAGAPTPPI